MINRTISLALSLLFSILRVHKITNPVISRLVRGTHTDDILKVGPAHKARDDKPRMQACYLTQLILLFFISHTSLSFGAGDLNKVAEKRYIDLTKEIRCVVCQGQSIADSNAPLAKDLRQKILEQVRDNKTDAEIKDYLAKRYGEFILLRPRLSAATLLLWTFPAFCLCFFAVRFFQRHIRP